MTDRQNEHTPGPWGFACDSYGKVRHSRKACVYATVTNGDGADSIVSVASRIENWNDAKLIASAPKMRDVLVAVLHQMEHGEAADVVDGEATDDAARRDLQWCRREIQTVLSGLTGEKNND